jgi:hypothetical protein
VIASELVASIREALFGLPDHRKGELKRPSWGRTDRPLGGTQYHRSKTIYCRQCSTRTLSNGETQYTHTVATPVIVGPEQPQVFALPPAFVTPQDGQEKRNCELNAAT